MGAERSRAVAFLWDESFLWGLMAYKALRERNLPFKLIRSDDIRRGELKNYSMLFVPGGWASNKMKALGKEGISEIRRFVYGGGNYLGLCGGAGLATLDGIGLLAVRRMPTGQRVPSFSGRIHLNINNHPIWNSPPHRFITPPAIFHAWWPSQFIVDDSTTRILATYGDALPDSFSSDLNVGDVEVNGGWSELEEIYKINLDPRRLKGAPSVVEGTLGEGRVILSLIHFDTPDDPNGAIVLENLWEYLSGQGSDLKGHEQEESPRLSPSPHHLTTLSTLADLESMVDDLISLGIRNFLWFWRNPMLLQWRRGVRGLEYCTLYIMIKEIAEMAKMTSAAGLEPGIGRIKELLAAFTKKAKQLLVLERYAMQNGNITYERCDDPRIQEIRTELFGNSKSHGGLFKRLLGEVDSVLYALIKCGLTEFPLNPYGED